MRMAGDFKAELMEKNQGIKVHDPGGNLRYSILFDPEDIDALATNLLILVSKDWCWKQFMALDDPSTEWALKVLKQWEGYPV